MKFLTNHKIIFIFLGVLLIAHGFLFFFGDAELMTMDFPNITEVTEEMSAVLIYTMEIVAGFNWILGVLLLFCSRLKFPEVKIVLIGLGIGLFCMVPVTIIHAMQAFNPGPIIISLIAIWVIFAGVKGGALNSNQ